MRNLCKPLNTGILHIKNRELVDMYTAEALKMAKDNHNKHNNSNCITMCNAEQRLLGEIVKQAISEVGATSMKDMGKIMANVMPKIKGRADGGE